MPVTKCSKTFLSVRYKTETTARGTRDDIPDPRDIEAYEVDAQGDQGQRRFDFEYTGPALRALRARATAAVGITCIDSPNCPDGFTCLLEEPDPTKEGDFANYNAASLKPVPFTTARGNPGLAVWKGELERAIKVIDGVCQSTLIAFYRQELRFDDINAFVTLNTDREIDAALVKKIRGALA